MKVLVCKLALIHRGQGKTKKRGRPLQVGRWKVLISKGAYLQGLFLVATRQIDDDIHPSEYEVYSEALSELSPISSRCSQQSLTLARLILETVPEAGAGPRGASYCVTRLLFIEKLRRGQGELRK